MLGAAAEFDAREEPGALEADKPTDSLLDFSLFVAFFPQLVAGPIERARELLPQISKLPRPSKEQVEAGIVLIAVGMFKKVMIGDAAGRFVDPIFAEPVCDVGYKWCFMTNSAVISSRTNPLQLQRANLESDNPPSVVRIQLSGLMDLMYAAKRRRVNRITAAPPSQVRSVEATGPGGGD